MHLSPHLNETPRILRGLLWFIRKRPVIANPAEGYRRDYRRVSSSLGVDVYLHEVLYETNNEHIVICNLIMKQRRAVPSRGRVKAF